MPRTLYQRGTDVDPPSSGPDARLSAVAHNRGLGAGMLKSFVSEPETYEAGSQFSDLIEVQNPSLITRISRDAAERRPTSSSGIVIA
jgi:hypothetical protein